jgi:hypothetical protein
MSDLIQIILNANQQRKLAQLMYNKQNLNRIKKMDALAPNVMSAFWPLTRLPLPMAQFL